MTIPFLKPLMPLGAFGYLCVYRYSVSQSQPTSIPIPSVPLPLPMLTFENIISTAGVLVATAFFVSQLYSQFKQTKHKLADDDRRIVTLENNHRRLSNKFYVLVGALAPILKDADIDLTRKGIVGKIFEAIDDEPLTDEGLGDKLPE